MENDSLIKIAVEENSIVIRVKIDDLVFIVENDPVYNYKVIDKQKFAKEIAFELQNSKSFSNDDGMNAVEEIFQNAYERVYEQGDDDIMTYNAGERPIRAKEIKKR